MTFFCFSIAPLMRTTLMEAPLAYFYRVTHQKSKNLPLTSISELRISKSCPIVGILDNYNNNNKLYDVYWYFELKYAFLVTL